MNCKARLKHNQITKQEIKVCNFVQSTEYEVNMHAKFKNLNL
jgi:hypothetical protein